jgi:hypothetical protein
MIAQAVGNSPRVVKTLGIVMILVNFINLNVQLFHLMQGHDSDCVSQSALRHHNYVASAVGADLIIFKGTSQALLVENVVTAWDLLDRSVLIKI